MESDSRPGHETASAADALDLIKQAERETYISDADIKCRRKKTSTAFKVSVTLGGIVALTAAMWIMSRVGTWWGAVTGGVIVGVFVAIVSRVEKSVHDVAPKMIMPRHLYPAAIKQMWPMSVVIGLMTPAVLWAINTAQPLWLLAAIATVEVVGGTGVLVWWLLRQQGDGRSPE